jgi:RNA polymerase sigma-70 factor, ECF subfamily
MEITQIHQEFHTVLNNYISKRVNNSTDVEDLLQEVFIKIHGGMSTLHKGESLKSWLFTVTRNTIIDYYRKNGKKNVLLDENYLDENIAEESDVEPGADLQKCIHRFIDQLPDEYRGLIIDSELNGIKQKDLAGKYNMAYSSVRSRVQRGRSRLKEMFLDCCKIEMDRRGNIMDATPKGKKC